MPSLERQVLKLLTNLKYAASYFKRKEKPPLPNGKILEKVKSFDFNKIYTHVEITFQKEE